jgi:ParB family chromosome partitioning protein
MRDMEHVNVGRNETVPVDSVRPHPQNARRGNTERIERSLRAHGQYKPLVVQESTGLILAGNHTWHVMRDRLGATHVLAQFVACSDEKALAILAVDNRASDGTGYDDSALLALLQELDETGGLIDGGYAESDLDDLVAALEEALPLSADPAPNALYDVAPAVGIDARKQMWAEGDGGSTRMMLLQFPLDTFAWVQRQMAALAEKYGMDSNPDTLVAVLADVTGEPAP